MKNKLVFLALAALSVSFLTCNKSIDKPVAGPLGFGNTLSGTPTNKVTVTNFMLNSYSLLDGVYPTQTCSVWETGTDNWIYGSVAGGEAHKGSTPTDQIYAAQIGDYTEVPSNIYFNDKWQVN